MWKRLNEEEKRNLMVNYKLGAYIVRFLMGAWLLFLTVGYAFGIQGAIDSIGRGDYFSGIGSIIFGTIAGIIFYGIPIVAIKKIGTEEMKALKNDEVYWVDAIFISSRRSFSNRKRPARYLATVNILDDWGNVYKQIECRSISNLRNSCKAGDRITILRLVKENQEEFLAMNKKLI